MVFVKFSDGNIEETLEDESTNEDGTNVDRVSFNQSVVNAGVERLKNLLVKLVQ